MLLEVVGSSVKLKGDSMGIDEALENLYEMSCCHEAYLSGLGER